jgi:hypothetical protein
MHIAMRLALSAGRRVRREHPGLPICFYGLDATVSRELIERELAAPAIAGEYEPALTAWVDELAASCAPAPDAERPIIHLQRGTFDPPARELLPGLERYACLASGWSGTWRPATGACIAAGIARSPPCMTGVSASCRPRPLASPIRSLPLRSHCDHVGAVDDVAALGATQQRPRGVDAIAAHARFGLTGFASRALALPRTGAPTASRPGARLAREASVR